MRLKVSALVGFLWPVFSVRLCVGVLYASRKASLTCKNLFLCDGWKFSLDSTLLIEFWLKTVSLLPVTNTNESGGNYSFPKEN